MQNSERKMQNEGSFHSALYPYKIILIIRHIPPNKKAKSVGTPKYSAGFFCYDDKCFDEAIEI